MEAKSGASALAGATFRSDGRLWLRDFAFGLTGLTVRKTGARVPYSPSVLAEVAAWFRYFFAVLALPRPSARFKIAFYPETARPWYFVWAVSRMAGAEPVRDPALADVVMHFEDATFSPNDPPARLKPGARLLNFRCRDISKTRVAAVFGEVFGYGLAVDPQTHVGPAVEKSEINAAHDGRIVQCPTKALPGRCYQRVIDNRGADLDLVDDLRTVIVGGKIGCVFIKRRPISKRFQNTNVEVLLRDREEIFSAPEMAQIEAFADRLGLDWGGVDVLRDRADGRLYIVDANKTEMGPPISLAFEQKLRALDAMSKAFRAFVTTPGG